MEQRLTLEECAKQLEGIARALRDHIGQKVLLITKEGRGFTPVIAVLKPMSNKIYGEYRHYTKDGAPCGLRRMFINPKLIHTGEMQIEYFDDGI